MRVEDFVLPMMFFMCAFTVSTVIRSSQAISFVGRTFGQGMHDHLFPVCELNDGLENDNGTLRWNTSRFAEPLLHQ